MPNLRLLAAAAFTALALPAATAATASADVPPGATWKEYYIDTPGEPKLHVDVFRPEKAGANEKTPVILSAGPYFGHGGQSTPDGDPTGIATGKPGANRPSDRFDDMIIGGKALQKGYTIVYADLRGFGGSAGCNDFGATGEQTDVKRAVEWAASQPWSTGKVGMWGKSYDAWTQVMALDEKPKGLAATIIQSPIIDGYRTLHQNGVHYDSGWYTTPALYQQIDAIPPAPGDNAEYLQAWASGFKPDCYAGNITSQNTKPDWSDPFWQVRNLPNARGSNIPTMWSHGFLDINTKPDNFMDVWKTLTGPKHAWFGQYAHDRGNEVNKIGRKGFLEEAMRWLDKYVKGDGTANVDADPTVTIQEGDGKWRAENAWPPSDGKMLPMPLKPGTVTDAPNNTARGEAEGVGGAPSGVGIYSATKPLPHEARIAGVPRAKVDVTAPNGRHHIYGLLYDVDPKGLGSLITRGAHVVTGNGTVDIELYPEDWTIKPGHRVLMLIAGSDISNWNPPHSNQTITVKGGTASVPYLQYKRTGFLTGGLATAMAAQGRKVQFDLAKVTGGEVAAELPAALQPFPAGQAPRGGTQITEKQAQAIVNQAQSQTPGAGAGTRSAAGTKKKAGMRVVVKRVKLGRKGKRGGRRGYVAIITGATVKKVRVDLLKGKRLIAKRTVKIKKGTARVILRQRGKGKFRVLVRSTAKSKKVLARSNTFRGR